MNIRNKGSAGERELCKILTERLNLAVPLTRNLEQTRDGGADLVQLKPFYIEVKRQETLCLPKWLAQAVRQTPNGSYPVLAFRQSRKPWRFLLPLSMFIPRSEEGWVEVDLDGFAQVYRNKVETNVSSLPKSTV